MKLSKKNILLIIGFVIGLFVSYHLAFKKTFQLKSELHKLKSEQAIAKKFPEQLAMLSLKERHLDSVIKANRLYRKSHQHNLLRTLNELVIEHDLKLIKFEEPHVHITETVTISTYEISIEGSFNDCLNLMYFIEQKSSFGEIISLNFERKKDLRTNRLYLRCKFLLQRVS